MRRGLPVQAPCGAVGATGCFSSSGGMSLTELIIVIAVIGVIAAVSIPSITNTVRSSSYETAKRNLNMLNAAVISFNEGNWELVLTSSSGSDDEQAIFNSLCYRNPDVRLAAPGSPYLPTNANFVASTASNTYRAKWNGRMFEVVPPGSNGTGLDLMRIMGGLRAAVTNTPVPASTN